ncbi:MAG TPA: hypothetical protein VKE69_03425, partial [Planctomycetota bacterium]|nr:hypothetical protein [Planctomycetota bacterium]
MKAASFFLAVTVVLLALVTAAWRSQASALSVANVHLESQIAWLSRVRDTERADVDRLRQPFVVRDRRLQSLAEDPKKPIAVAKANGKKKPGAKTDLRARGERVSPSNVERASPSNV